MAAPGSAAGDLAAAATAPIDAVTLAAARTELRAARSRGRHADADAGYTAVLGLLDGARGVYARPAAAVMADAALALSRLADVHSEARAYATASLEHAGRSGDAARERRARLRLRRLPG